MRDNKKLDNIRDERVHKKTLPYSVTECSTKPDIKQWYADREGRSIKYRVEARERTIAAWTQVSANVDALNNGTFRRQTYDERNAIYTSKPSIFTRIYNYLFNFFVTINF